MARLAARYLAKAVGVHHTETSDSSWDGPENEKRLPSPMPMDTAEAAYAWMDMDMVEEGECPKSACKFIHHEVDADGEPGYANVQACRSGIGVLNGGRGGTNIPDEDRQGVYNHLAAHMRDADEEPPELQDHTSQPSARSQLPEIEIPSFLSAPPLQMRQRAKRRDWYRFQNAADDPEKVDLYIYDEIVEPFLQEFLGIGISALGFVRDLQQHRGKALDVHINSPGGVIFEGLAIYNALRSHDAPVHTIVDGIAASSASIIAMAGTRVTMRPHSMMMIHEPYGFTMGNAADHELQAKVLNKIADDLAAVYRERGDSRVNWRALMKAETWLSDEDAVRYKLADDISSEPAVQNSFDLSAFRNVPEHLNFTVHPIALQSSSPTERDAERALRDAGFSQARAKAIVAQGFDAPHRDGEVEDPESEQAPTAVAESTGMVDQAAAEEPAQVAAPSESTGMVDQAAVARRGRIMEMIAMEVA